ncbi:MAG: D-2-hydroxyacid dehydrogenase [Candidatus Azotimanducaceae bacterium]
MGLKILIIPGLTLTEIPEQSVISLESAAGTDSEIVISEYADAHKHIGDADIVLGIVTPKLFSAAKKLRWVQSISSGVDSFMYPEFINSDVLLTSEKGLVGEHLADHAFGLLLALTRQLAAARDLGPDSWNNRPGLRAQEVELTGLNLGIIGFGGTGRAVAKRAHAFGLRIRAIDKDLMDGTDSVNKVESAEALDDLLAWSDILAICCPLTEETDKLINQETLGQLKTGAYIINVTRGEIIDEDSLVDALKSGHVRGAGLDVTPREPLPAESELWRLPNVVMTPHTAGASQYRASRNLERFISNVEKFRQNLPLDGIIDKVEGY